VVWTVQCKARRDAQAGCLRERRNTGKGISGALQCAVQTTFPEGSHQNRRWTALRSLQIDTII